MEMMQATKPTPIDLTEYVKHSLGCDARKFHLNSMDDNSVNSYGECDCGLHALLDALGLRKANKDYY